jgi:hypothetical protein
VTDNTPNNGCPSGTAIISVNGFDSTNYNIWDGTYNGFRVVALCATPK